MAYGVMTDSTCSSYIQKGTEDFTSRQRANNRNTINKFKTVIEIHNSHLNQLRNWRRLMAEYSSDIADLVISFPEAEGMDHEVLKRLFSTPNGLNIATTGEEVFTPWIQWWSGTWSNGNPQYHIWHQTELFNGQWIQAVTQSESGFVEYQNLEASVRNNRVDLGINVYSSSTGISGWVSKRQHGRLELPHIGYLYDAETIIWICQPQPSEGLLHNEQSWFVFLEKIEKAARAPKYSIQGKSFRIVNKKIVYESSEHHGIYHAHLPRA